MKSVSSVLYALTGATMLFAGTGFASAEDKVTMAAWGGGGAVTIKRAYAAPFTEATGIPFELVEVPDPTAAISAAQGQPPYNVAVAASFQAVALANRGLVHELTPEDIPEINNIPREYWVTNDEGKIIGMPVYFLYLGIAYNTDLAEESDFQSWHDLVDSKWKDQVSMTRPVFAAPYDLTMFAKINGGDEKNIEPGVPMLRSLAENTLNVYTSMANFQSQLSRGEVAAAPYYSSQIMIMKRQGVENVDMIIPEEGGLALSYLYVIPKGAKDVESAKKFLNSVAKVQSQLLAAEDGYLPLNPQAELTPELAAEFGFTLEELMERTYAPDWNVIGSAIEERVSLVEEIIDSAQ